MTDLNEQVTVKFQITATVTDLDKLRLAASFNFQQDGVGEVHTMLPDGDAQQLTKMYFGKELISIVTKAGCFSDPVVTAE